MLLAVQVTNCRVVSSGKGIVALFLLLELREMEKEIAFNYSRDSSTIY